MNSSIKTKKRVKIANPSSASMTRNPQILPKTPSIHIPIALPFSCLVPTLVGHPVQSFSCLAPTLVGHPVQSFCYIDDQKFRVRIPSIPKKPIPSIYPTYSLCLAIFCVLNFGGTPCTVLHTHPSLLLKQILRSELNYYI